MFCDYNRNLPFGNIGIAMTIFESILIKRVFAKEFVQGPNHKRNIEYIYRLVREACENEFTEDNAHTLDAFLRECFEATQYDSQNPAMEQVALDLHSALGVKWGEDPYGAIKKLKESPNQTPITYAVIKQ